MSYTINGKTYRNLEEQVLENSKKAGHTYSGEDGILVDNDTEVISPDTEVLATVQYVDESVTGLVTMDEVNDAIDDRVPEPAGGDLGKFLKAGSSGAQWVTFPVSGTNDGTNWTSLSISGTTMSIPAGGSSNFLIIDSSEVTDALCEDCFTNKKALFVKYPKGGTEQLFAILAYRLWEHYYVFIGSTLDEIYYFVCINGSFGLNRTTPLLKVTDRTKNYTTVTGLTYAQANTMWNNGVTLVYTDVTRSYFCTPYSLQSGLSTTWKSTDGSKTISCTTTGVWSVS